MTTREKIQRKIDELQDDIINTKQRLRESKNYDYTEDISYHERVLKLHKKRLQRLFSQRIRGNGTQINHSICNHSFVRHALRAC